EETRPRVSRSRVGSMRAPKSPTNRRPGGETATRLTIRWAIERPGSTTGTDMDRQAPFVSIEWRRVSGADRADPLITALPSTELPTQPLPHFRDGVINLGHTAGAHDERVL